MLLNVLCILSLLFWYFAVADVMIKHKKRNLNRTSVFLFQNAYFIVGKIEIFM